MEKLKLDQTWSEWVHVFSRAHNFSFFPREIGLSYQSSSISFLSVNTYTFIHSLPFYPEGTVSAGSLKREGWSDITGAFSLHNLNLILNNQNIFLTN